MAYLGDEDLEGMDERESMYEAPDFEKSREKKSTKLSNEIRKLVQSIHTHKALDKDWKTICSQLRQLAEHAFEAKMNSNSGNHNENKHMNQQQMNGTLWDNMNNKEFNNHNGSITESVVRLILEEGKLNLLLRILTNYKAVELEDTFKVRMENECNRNKIRMSALIQLCAIYEESLGILLYFCLERMESLQILDIEHLVQYIADILERKQYAFAFNQHALNGSTKSQQMERMSAFHEHLFANDKRQEIMVIYYLFILSTHFHEISFEEKVMALIAKYRVIQKSINYVMKYHELLSVDVLQKYTLFLSNCFQTESFSAEPETFVSVGTNDDDDEDDEDLLQDMDEYDITPKLLCTFYEQYFNEFVKVNKVLSMKQVRGFMKQYPRLKRMI